MSDNDKILKALKNTKIPIVTLDNKWHKIFAMVEKPDDIKQDEAELVELLKRQGKINSEIKEIKRVKKKLMDEIVEAMESDDSKVEKNRKMVEEYNARIDSYQDEMLDLPARIDEINKRIMLSTMSVCYDVMHDNDRGAQELADWIAGIRVELKKNIVKKQEMEIQNAVIYSYMHDVFGQQAMDIFDMNTDPMEKIAALKK